MPFKTNNSTRMTMQDNTGYFGIGTSSPSELLQVLGGNIDVSTSSKSYMINSTPVLWHNGDPSSIFVGVGAGASAPASGTLQNTLIGFEAGTSITSGDPNVAVGYQALYSSTQHGWNTAVGYQALYSLNASCGSCWNHNNENTAVGYQALLNSQAYGGCALGFWAARDNTFGCSLVAIGEQAARSNTEGNDNVAVGHDAMGLNHNLSNNVAVGTDALGLQSYTSTTACPPDANGDPTYGCVSSWNVAVGNYALENNNPSYDRNGVQNTAVGDHAFWSNITGYSNVGLGYQSGYSNQYGFSRV